MRKLRQTLVTWLLLATAMVLPVTLYAGSLPQQEEPPCMMTGMADDHEMLVDDSLQAGCQVGCQVSCETCALCSGCSHCGTTAALVATMTVSAPLSHTGFTLFSARLRALYPPTDIPPPRHS